MKAIPSLPMDQYSLKSFGVDQLRKLVKHSSLDDGTVSVRNVCVTPEGNFKDICGYADIPDPAHPGELQVAPIGQILIQLCMDFRHSITVLYPNQKVLVLLLFSECV